MLDAMMGTLTFGTTSLPDTALAEPTSPWPLAAGGSLLLLAEVGAIRKARRTT